MSDLISREALKKAFENLASDDYNEPIWYQKTVFETIDNAPTVEYTFEEAFQKTVCEQRLYCPARLQGEWIEYSFRTCGGLGDWDYKCSKCEKVYGGKHNFCPNCGADMRKGGGV